MPLEFSREGLLGLTHPSQPSKNHLQGTQLSTSESRDAPVDHCLQEELPLHLHLHQQELHWQWVCIPKPKPDLPLSLSLKVLSPAQSRATGCPCLQGAPGSQSRALLGL